jgi:hypothetical protein
MAIHWPDILKRYGLAACCIVGPLLFGLVGIYLPARWLLPDPDPEIVLPYSPSLPAPSKATIGNNGESVGSTPGSRARTISETSAAAPSFGTLHGLSPLNILDNKPDVQSNFEFWMIGQNYRGRLSYAIASAFIYLISGAVFIFSMTVVWPRLGRRWTLTALVAFAALAMGLALYASVPQGRTFIVEDLLNQADTSFPFVSLLRARSGGTGTAARMLVQWNTFISFWSIGMLLTALFVLSIRPKELHLALNELQNRLILLRVALGLGSTFLVIGVLAQKVLMEWPLGLVASGQTEGLGLLASALTLQLGAQGTLALVAAFGPAIAAWSLDATSLRRQTSPAGKPGTAAAGVPPDNSRLLAFAPLSAITSFLAVLAPLLASPFVDALGSIFTHLTKG